MTGARVAADGSAGVPVVTDNPHRSRFELHVGGELAGFVDYRLRGHVLNLVHTEVLPKYQGEGLAADLARASLDAARERHLAVIPSCPYIRSWLGSHPEYADLVPEDRRAGFGL